jgi:1-acyl-sn-glycerol-3-phosphate acyltransferase
VATLTPPSDRAAIETQVLAITRDLLRELGNKASVEALKGSSRLERDLGLGSVERVELMSRLEKSLGRSLPENAVAEARTLDDIITTVAGPPEGSGAGVIEQGSAEFLGDSDAGFEASYPGLGQVDSAPRQDRLGGADTAYEHGGLFWRALETIYGIYAAAVFLVWLVLSWLVLLLMPRGQAAARMTSTAIGVYFRLIWCPLTVEGREHLDAYGACIYVSNHTSYSDVLAVMAVLQTNYHFVAKNEINHMPFIGTFLRKLGHFAFERRKLRERSRQAEQMEKALIRGESVFVFAEGTFTAQAGVRPFSLGAFRAAVKTGRPIVPVALRGTRRFLRDGTFLPKHTRISVIACPALVPAPEAPGREWAEVLRLRDEARRVISSHSGEPLLSAPEGEERS